MGQGFSLLMFGATIWIHVSRRHIHQVNRKILVIACLLLLFSTVVYIFYILSRITI